MIGAMLLMVGQAAAPQALPASREASAHSHIHARGEINEDQPPLLLETSYTFDVLSNLSGGLRRGTRYLDNLDLVAEADLERLVGWSGALVHVYGLYNNGTPFGSLVGDEQVISNIETGTRAVRLYEAWISQEVGETASLKLGLYDLNSEFDSLDSSGLFTGSAHGIGTDFSQSGENAPSIFPVTSLAARASVEVASGWHVRAAVLDAVPGDPARPNRTAIKLGDGALLVGEIEAPIASGGKLLFGHWRYTAPQDRLDGSAGKGADGFYLRGETTLIREAGTQGQGLDGFFRLGLADGGFYRFGGFASAGLNWTGAIDGRDEDQIGFAIASAITSGEDRRLSGSERTETAFELTYRAVVNDWLSIQPGAHYIVNPAADPTIPNAFAIGLRTQLTWRLTR